MDSGSDTVSLKSELMFLTDLTQDEAPADEQVTSKPSVVIRETNSEEELPPRSPSEIKLQDDVNRKLKLLQTVQSATDIESITRASVLADQLHTVLFSDYDSTTSSEESSSSEEESTLMYEDMEADDILRVEYAEDVQDEESIEGIEPVESDSILRKTEFLDNFRLPSISEISLEPTVLPSEVTEEKPKENLQDEEVETEQADETIKTGDQVDATDGVADYSPESSQHSKQWQWLGDDLLELDDDSSLFNIKETVEKDEGVESAFIKFQTGSQHEFFQEDVDEIDPIKAKEHQDIIQVTTEFIYGLFDSVVDKVENRYKIYELEQNLDKNRLLWHMITLKNKLTYEYDICRYLNTKMFEYFKRQKTIRAFTLLDPDTQAKEFRRFGAALKQLDRWIKVAAATKQRNVLLISSVYMDLTYVRNMALHTEEHLENAIRKTLAANKSENMQHFVERELRLMTQMRNEISDTRLFLITRKHTLAVYIEKTRKLERISDELCMDDFIYINNQVVALDKKIEERNNELKKMRNNYHSDLHDMQHNREKTLSLQAKLLDWQNTYSQKMSIRNALRRRLYDAKIAHSRIRKQHADLSYNGGLLAMPSLMYDYDETVARLEDKQAKIKLLKETFKQVSQRLVELESRCI